MPFAYTTATISGARVGMNTPAAFIQAASTFLQGSMGWSLVEDRTAQAGTNHKMILRSNGEDNAASTFYLIMTSGTNTVGFQAGTFWDTGLHNTGSGTITPLDATTAVLQTSTDKTVQYWLSGDKESFNAISRTNGEYDAIHFGRITPFNSAVNDPFPVYVVGETTQNVNILGAASNQCYSFVNGNIALATGTNNDWDAVYTQPVNSNMAPDNTFGSLERFVCFPLIASVSITTGNIRKSVRGFSKNLWVTIGPSTTSLQPEDMFTSSATGRTYQVFFDAGTNQTAVVIRRS